MSVWVVANQKGGVGKTTTAVTLGGLSAGAGRKTLLVDLDPHGSLTAYFGLDPETSEAGVYSLFANEVEGRRRPPDGLIHDTAFNRLHVLPASTALATLDRQLGMREGMGLVIARALGGLDGRFPSVIIDCPPMLGVLLVNALAACDHLIIPVQTEFLALKGLERMLRTLEMIRSSGKHGFPYTILPTLFDRRTRASIDSLRLLRDKYPRNLWRHAIPVDTQFREASRRGVPLPLMLPEARGVQAYRRLMGGLLEAADEAPQAAVR